MVYHYDISESFSGGKINFAAFKNELEDSQIIVISLTADGGEPFALDVLSGGILHIEADVDKNTIDNVINNHVAGV